MVKSWKPPRNGPTSPPYPFPTAQKGRAFGPFDARGFLAKGRPANLRKATSSLSNQELLRHICKYTPLRLVPAAAGAHAGPLAANKPVHPNRWQVCAEFRSETLGNLMTIVRGIWSTKRPENLRRVHTRAEPRKCAFSRKQALTSPKIWIDLPRAPRSTLLSRRERQS